MRKKAIFEQQKNSGVKPSIFNRIIEGPPPSFERNSPTKMVEENEFITDCFESGFKDSTETIYQIVSTIPADITKEYQARHLRRDYTRNECFEDPSLSPKAVWVTQVSCFTLLHNVAIFYPLKDEMKSHMKRLNLTTKLEDWIISKTMVDGVASINILPKSMLRRFGKIVDDLIPHNIVIFYFCRKASRPDGMICLDVFVGN